jgi:hypothetical protein
VRLPVLGKELDPVLIGLSALVGAGECGGAGGGSTLWVMGVSSRTLVGNGSSAANAFGGRTPACRGRMSGTGTPCAHCIPGGGAGRVTGRA